MSLIKSQLIQIITEKNPHLFLRDVERIVATIFNEITNSLAAGRRVELRGFGAFSIQERKERVGRNPRTGDAVMVQAKSIPRFKTGKELSSNEILKKYKSAIESGLVKSYNTYKEAEKERSKMRKEILGIK